MAVKDDQVCAVRIVGQGAVFDQTQFADHVHITVLNLHRGQGDIAQSGHSQIAACRRAAGSNRGQGHAIVLDQTALLHLKDRAQAGLVTIQGQVARGDTHLKLTRGGGIAYFQRPSAVQIDATCPSLEIGQLGNIQVDVTHVVSANDPLLTNRPTSHDRQRIVGQANDIRRLCVAIIKDLPLARINGDGAIRGLDLAQGDVAVRNQVHVLIGDDTDAVFHGHGAVVDNQRDVACLDRACNHQTVA